MNLYTFFPLLLILLLHSSTTTLAQTAESPEPPGPTNITKILEKAGQFTTFMRLLKLTQQTDQINSILNNSNQGLTIFAPPDNAFSALKAGILNTLNDEQKVALVQFHVLPTFLPMQQFQTASNPLRTQAGDNGPFDFPLNVTTSGNQVNISTGVNDATVANSIYTDGQLAVYQVDKVLLPMNIFGPPAPTLPPAPAVKPKKKLPGAPVSGDDNAPADASGGVGFQVHGMLMVVSLGIMALFHL